jgi:hypothetical protein
MKTPNLILSLLQVQQVQHFFRAVLVMIARLAPRGYPELNALLDPLMDESQTFYQNFGHEEQLQRMQLAAACESREESGPLV